MNVHGYYVPPAVGDPSPVWPLPEIRPRITGDVGDPRARGERYHVGEDVHAPPGTRVVAPEGGKVVNVYRFTRSPTYRADTDAVVLRGDSGLVIVLGELDPDTIAVRRGEHVGRGQTIGYVGELGMLHLETYARGSSNRRWRVGEPPPDALRDPAPYLQRAAGQDPTPQAPPTRPSPPPEPPRPLPESPLPELDPPELPPAASGSAAPLVLALLLLGAA